MLWKQIQELSSATALVGTTSIQITKLPPPSTKRECKYSCMQSVLVGSYGALECRSMLPPQCTDVVARLQDVTISSPGDIHPLVEGGVNCVPHAAHCNAAVFHLTQWSPCILDS